MGIFRETLAEGTEGALGPERPRVYSDLSPKDKDRYNADIRATNILLQGLPKDVYSLINHYTDAKDIWDNVKMLLEGSELTKEDRESQLYDDFEHFRQHKGETIHDYYIRFAKLINDMRNIKMTMSRMQLNSKFVNNMLPEWGRFVTAVKLNRGLRDSNYDQLYAYLKHSTRPHANENKMIHIARNCTQPKRPQNSEYFKDKMLLMQAQENGVALDEEQFTILLGTDDYDAFDSNVNEASTAQTMFMANLSSADHVYDEVGLSYDSDILSEEQVELYERQAMFELTEREQKIDEQLRIVITDHNIKEENLKKELHSVKLQLASTINHNKSMVEEVTSLKKDFKQKENKYLEEFLDMKALKEKVEDRLYKQDQSLQTVHMLCKPKPYYNELNKVAIGYKNPLCLTHAKQVQPALYNGYEIVKNNHVPAIVHNTEDTLEIAEITRRKMHDKMKDPECVTHKVKIAPPDYSKENYLATFTPQKQLTPKQIFWSQDIIKIKAEALKEQTTASRPTKALTVNNSEVHQLSQNTKESVETLRGIVEEAKPLNTRDNKHASTSLPKKKQVTFEEQCAMSKSNTHKPVKQLNCQKTNVLVPPSTGVNSCTDASGSQPRSNTKKNRILPAKSVNMKKVEEHPRIIKSSLKTTNRVDSSISSKRTVINSNSHSVCQTCNKCLISANHDMCVVTYLHSVNASPSVKNVVRKVKQVWKPKQVKQVWKPTGNILTTVGYRSRAQEFREKSSSGRVRFGNDHFGAIMGYGDYVIGESVISRVYYVEGLGHNLFSVGQFCDSDLEVAFRKHSCYVRDTDGVELIKGSRGSNLYTISIEDMLKSSPICLLSKASKNKSWLWHRRLNHLNFGTINDLARKDLVRGLPRLKFEKDHLCFACQLGKSKKHKPKTENTNLEVLNTLYMDYIGPMRVQTINGKKYILVIVDDYSRFTWVKFLRSKDETPEVVIKFLKKIQFGLNKTTRNIRTDNGTEFVNKDLTDYYERVGIFHQKTVPRTPQQNGVVERRNRTLVEAARNNVFELFRP
ncbi:retrovirus-related pol polyprotein from transposon TNT 1-94 [Tanacetum coccineum]